VYYQIQAEINPETDIISGTEKLMYWNNSPKELTFVYFHLYQNAFQPGSYYDDLQKNNNIKPRYGRYESIQKGTEVLTILVDGQVVETELDNTILKVFLNKPLPPGGSIVFDIEFLTYFDKGSVRRRMKKFKESGHIHYNGVHWYPRISVYDRKFGWTTDQHLGREFYGDFGAFDVELTFPANYVVEATGYLLNREEVLPDSLRYKLDVRNFKDKPFGDPASTIIEYDPEVKKTWKYHAENVHDFAFTADPTYRIGEAWWNGIQAVAMVREPNAQGWLTAADYTAKIIECFSEDFGMYEYNKIVVADAEDGMEYPMITLDDGKSPSYNGLLVHEVGHNWYFGMLGNNETYRALMDEGFTQFLTAWGLEKLDGKYMIRNESKIRYVNRFRNPVVNRDNKAYDSYLWDATRHQDPHLNTHSDGFNGAVRQGGGYRHVYSKTATMFYNLQYVLGDSLFLAAMQNYTWQWKICHPYPEDFRNSFIDFTGVDLNWFFDQWLETNKNIDYEIKSVKKKKDDQYHIKIKRKGRMQMPLDIAVIDKNNDTINYYIPNTWFEKYTDAITLPRWIGWDKLQPTYTASVNSPNGIKDVIIDPTNRLADINPTNNRKKPLTKWYFDSKIYNKADRYAYVWKARPNIWYNAYDGIKLGLHLNGEYFRFRDNMDFNFWWNTRLAQGSYNNFEEGFENDNDLFSYTFKYATSVAKVIPGGKFWFEGNQVDGLDLMEIGLSKRFSSRTSASIYTKTFIRKEKEDLLYLLYPEEWEEDRGNNSLNFQLNTSFPFLNSSARFNTTLRSSSLGSDYDYHYLNAELKHRFRKKRLDIGYRLFARIGSGKDLASESALYFYGENPEEMMKSPWLRSKGFIPASWVGNFGGESNHFHSGGGLNMRGYSGYLLVETDEKNNTVAAYKGNSGVSVNIEVAFDRFFPIQSATLRRYFDMDLYLFADGGSIVYENSIGESEFSKWRMDAGIGSTFTIKRFWFLNEIKPFTVRFDMPIYLSDSPATEDNFKFRWVFAIGKAF
ncbi:MAG: M1 family metallopeptidase, partial [Chitinophagales bacterium]|nr:M1 family metallopeptidase [Chitinophagales bacterium]